jgi:O-acetyl-ADP-ribose deacetylase (regulator of RNase III)
MPVQHIRDFINGRLLVCTGDITQLAVDAIVNAANSSLLGGGGVDGAIHRTAGPSLLEECREIRRSYFPQGLPTGEAVITKSGNLPARHVIHTVGPIWGSGTSDCPRLLALCYANSLRLAAKHGCTTIAFPAISTGVYGYPKEQAALVAFSTVTKYLETHDLPKTVNLIFFSASDAQIFIHAVDR